MLGAIVGDIIGSGEIWGLLIYCTEAQVKAMIRDSNADGNDSILIEYYGMDDIDSDSLRQYRTEFRQENSTHLWIPQNYCGMEGNQLGRTATVEQTGC